MPGIVDAIAMDMDIFSRVTYHKIEIMPEEQWMSMKDKISPYGVTNPGEEIRRAVYVEFPYRAMDFFRIRTEHGKKLAASAEQDGGVASAVQPRIHGTLWGCLPAWSKTLYRRDTGERQ